MDLSTDFQTVSGRTALAQAIVRRWSTERGELIDDPTYGTDLTNLINDDMTDADIAKAISDAELEALKDERVQAISGTYEVAPDDENLGEVLTITFEIVDAAGPFTLTIAIDSVTVSLLTVSP